MLSRRSYRLDMGTSEKGGVPRDVLNGSIE